MIPGWKKFVNKTQNAQAIDKFTYIKVNKVNTYVQQTYHKVIRELKDWSIFLVLETNKWYLEHKTYCCKSEKRQETQQKTWVKYISREFTEGEVRSLVMHKEKLHKKLENIFIIKIRKNKINCSKMPPCMYQIGRNLKVGEYPVLVGK